MSAGNFWWLAAVIAEHDARRVVGRTRLQKTVKLLQRVGLPTDYRFTIFFYGPYSEGIQSDVRLLERLGLVTETPQPAPEGATPSYVLTAAPEARLDGVARFRPALARLQAAELGELELAATYDAFREAGSDHAEALRRLRHKKAGKCTEDREARALELLRALGLPASGST
ncbi:MAG: hypothetical protein ACRC33_28655 [Gemmataceae bacterium]